MKQSNSKNVILRLFVLPPAGAGDTFFDPLRSQLAPFGIQLCPFQLPGRESRLLEKSHTQWSPLLTELHGMLAPYLTQPYALFGYSMGALIAYELAHQLRAQGAALPIRLFVAAHRAPHCPNRFSPIHHLPAPAFWKELQQFMPIFVALRDTPEFPELQEMLTPTLRADFTLLETYTYVFREPLNCPISVFGGMTDCDVQPEELVGWQAQTSQPIRLRLFPGNHYFAQESLEALCQAIVEDLACE